MSSNPLGSYRIPVLEWIRDYQREWIRWDLIAGLTAAAVVIPNAMAYATIAGLPVQAGLYTAFLPMVIYAVLGTSRPLSVSRTTTPAILAAASPAGCSTVFSEDLNASRTILGVKVETLLAQRPRPDLLCCGPGDYRLNDQLRPVVKP